MPEVDPAGHLRQLRDRVGALAPVPTALHGKLLRQSSVPASLATTPFVFVHRDGKKPLQTKGSNKQGCPRSTDNFSFRASESDAPIAANIQGSEERVRGNWLRDSRPLHLDRGGRPNTDFWMRLTVSQRRDAVDAAADQPPCLLIGGYTTNTLHRSLPGSRARGQDLHHPLQRQGGDCQHRPPQTGPHGLRGPGPGGPASTTGPTTSRTDAYTSRTGTSTSNQSARRALLPPRPNRPAVAVRFADLEASTSTLDSSTSDGNSRGGEWCNGHRFIHLLSFRAGNSDHVISCVYPFPAVEIQPLKPPPLW